MIIIIIISIIINIITPKEQAIANGRGSFESFLHLQLSNTFLIRIFAVPNKAVFCNSPILMVILSFSSHASNLIIIIIITIM